MEAKATFRFIGGMAVAGLGLFILISLVTRSPYEGPFPDYAGGSFKGNACGIAGAYVSAYALALTGYASYLLAAAVTVAGVLRMANRGLGSPVRKAVALALLAVAALLGLAMWNASAYSASNAYRAGPGLGGGVLGILLAGSLYRGIGCMGALILLSMCACTGTLLLAERQARAASARLVALAGRLGAGALRAVRLKKRAPRALPADAAVEQPEPRPEQAALSAAVDVAPEAVPIEEDEAASEVEMAAVEELLTEPEVVTRYSRLHEEEEDETDYGLMESIREDEEGDYVLPPVSLLEEFVSPPAEDETDMREKGRVLERTLREFGIGAQVVRVQRGPVITMYEVSLAPGTKVSRVESLSDDLAIALKAPNVRIVAPLPGKNTVGVEVPNTERELVGIRELMEEARSKVNSMAIPLLLGKDTAGNPLVLDLASCPHLLVAGATGSGKSVAINAIICSILMTRTPGEVQLMLVDPKAVEFTDYAQLPHLICPVLTDMKKAASVLKWACKKMDERYAVLSSVGVRDLKSYNALGKEEVTRRLDPEGDAIIDDVPFHMPHIVIIVDEFGELMMVAAKEVEGSVIRLSQKARAVGIHLICATQRPSVDVITGLIKSNLPARIAFQVASKVDSRTILDRNGADLLLGRGDMLLLPPGSSRLVRAQGSYVSEAEVKRVVEFLEQQSAPQFKAELQEYHAQQQGADGGDELFDDAVRVVLETQRGSVSLLQRRLSIGYSRAARLIDMMAEAGIVGGYAGSQARRVLMSLEKWEKARAQA